MLGQLPVFNQGIKIVSFCPLCETQYKVRHVQVIDEQEDAQLVHITCVKCQTSALALILNNQSGISSMGLVSDLLSHEVAVFKNKKPITQEEVLNFHNKLKQFTFDKNNNFKLF